MWLTSVSCCSHVRVIAQTMNSSECQVLVSALGFSCEEIITFAGNSDKPTQSCLEIGER